MIDVFSIESILTTFGYAALFGIVFAESGLFFGFFLPGDSLLFTAGLLAAKGYLNIYIIVIGTVVFAFLGDQVGYWSGKTFGTKFFCKPGSLFRDPKYVKRAEEFYARHGKKTIVLARFVPVVRTFAPIVAGTARMEYRTFLAYNALGAGLWGAAFTLAGFWLGGVIPETYLTVVILGIVVVSIIPVAREFYKGYYANTGRAK